VGRSYYHTVTASPIAIDVSAIDGGVILSVAGDVDLRPIQITGLAEEIAVYPTVPEAVADSPAERS